MSQLTLPTPSLLCGAFLFDSSKISAQQLRALWIKEWGSAIFLELKEFSMGDYYSKEMGRVENLQRFFGISLKLFKKDCLITGKLWADQQEQNIFSVGEKSRKRWVNIDIGRINLENFELATGKNFNHRIYLEHGIYSDLTYLYTNKKFTTLPWTYPDYRQERVIEFFTYGREYLKSQLDQQKIKK